MSQFPICQSENGRTKLIRGATVRQFRIVRKQGDRTVKCYHLDMGLGVTLASQLPPPSKEQP